MIGFLTCSRLVLVHASNVGSSRSAAMPQVVQRSRLLRVLPQALRPDPLDGPAVVAPSVELAQVRRGRARLRASRQESPNLVRAEARAAAAEAEVVRAAVAAEVGNPRQRQ